MMRMCWIPEGMFLMGSQMVTTCNQLKMLTADGKHYLTSAATMETLAAA
jgi:hypothetical protein